MKIKKNILIVALMAMFVSLTGALTMHADFSLFLVNSSTKYDAAIETTTTASLNEYIQESTTKTMTINHGQRFRTFQLPRDFGKDGSVFYFEFKNVENCSDKKPIKFDWAGKDTIEGTVYCSNNDKIALHYKIERNQEPNLLKITFSDPN